MRAIYGERPGRLPRFGPATTSDLRSDRQPIQVAGEFVKKLTRESVLMKT